MPGARNNAIKDTPEEAENMKLRSVLMKNHLIRTEMRLFGVTQARISELMRGKMHW